MSEQLEQTLPTTSRLFFFRLASAMLLRAKVYREITADQLATGQAATVVCLAGLAEPLPMLDELGLWGWPFKLLSAAAVWLCFSTVAYFLASLGGHRCEYRPFLRGLGFAQAPGILSFAASSAQQPLGLALRYAMWGWLCAAAYQAIQAATGAGVGRTMAIGVPSFLFRIILGFVIFLLWWRLNEFIQYGV
jgi:hypothetical protein